MRRPRFYRWIRKEALRLADASTFSLRQLAAQAQAENNDRLAAALLLYAHENGKLEQLYARVYAEGLLQEYAEVERHLGQRSIEWLALRGSPMMQLPGRYRSIMRAYALDYHAIDRIAGEKERLRASSHSRALELGVSYADLARALDLEPGNLHAYLERKELGRLHVEAARDIDAYLKGLAGRS